MKNKTFLLFLSLLAALFILKEKTHAQPNQELGIENLIPSSPEAAALGKYGEFPVGIYTGIPSISIPIWTISTPNLNHPVFLSYHASGRKVEEIATNVGLGWALNAGGVITRTIRHLADEATGGYYINPFQGTTDIEELDLDYVVDVRKGLKDGEPDLFYFNFGGYSGSFYFDRNSEIALVSKEDLRIEENFNNNTLEGFEVTTPNGDKYYFGGSNDFAAYTEVTSHRNSNNYLRDNISSWFLRKVVSANQIDSISFTYDGYESSSWEKSVSEMVTLRSGNLSEAEKEQHINYTKVFNRKRISSINFKNGTIVMDYQNSRLDITNSQSLDELSIYHDEDNLIKKVKFNYSYFKSNPNSTDGYELRLRLNSIQEFNNQGESKPPHTFIYYTGHNLPTRSSEESKFYAQDHWGFYNGANNMEKTLIPDFEYNGVTYNSANREPNWPYTKANMLEEIHYPTGGYTEFIFEPNYVGMCGPDTVIGYYVDEELWKDTLQCDDMWSQFDAGTFEIHDSLHNAFNLVLSLDTACNGNTDVNANIQVSIVGANKSYSLGYNEDNLEFTSANFIDTLAVGTYTLQIRLFRQSRFIYKFNYQKFVNEQIIIQRQFQQAGGIRVKEIINHSVFGSSTSKEYDYTYRNVQGEVQYSSGVITNIPEYTRHIIVEFQCMACTYETNWFGWITKSGVVTEYEPWDMIELSSHSNIPLGTTQGGIIGYTEVSEKNFEGETRYRYSTKHDFDDTDNFYFFQELTFLYNIYPDEKFAYPYPPPGNMDWARGKLLEKIMYNKDGNRVLKEKNIYKVSVSDNLVIKVVPMERESHDLLEYFNVGVFYNNISGWIRLDTTVTTHYVNDSPGVEIKKIFKYNGSDHLQLTELSENSSDGKTLKTTFAFPGDISTPSSVFMTQRAIDSMLSWYMIGMPIKIEKTVDGTIAKGQITSYTLGNGETAAYPTLVSRFEGNSYISKANYHYSTFGNINEYQEVNNIYSTYLWGYNHTYPIAKIDNAELIDVITIIYNENLDIQTEDSEELQAILEIIRNHEDMKDAMVTTYTYDPLVGMTSETTPNGKTMTYHYDDFNRLETIRDQDTNVLKHYDYNYLEGDLCKAITL